MSRLDRRVAGRDRRLGGSLRVTMPDLFALWLTPALAEFSHAFPAVELEVITGNAFANLSRRDADIALRTTNNPPESLVGRRLATVAFALYGSEAYLARHRDVRELSQHRWLGWDGTLADIATSRWMRQHLGGARFSYRVNSPAAMLAAVKAGLGVTFLLCFAADAEPTLRRLEPPRSELALGLWLLTHRDLRRTARVRSFVDFLANAIARERAALEGRTTLMRPVFPKRARCTSSTDPFERRR